MKFMQWTVMFGLLLAAPALHAQETDDGTELLHSCTAAITSFTAGMSRNEADLSMRQRFYCLGVVHGVRYMMYMWQVAATQEKRPQEHDMHGCVPTEVSNEQAIRVVIKYLTDHPEELHLHDVILANAALKDAFPCGTSKPSKR